MRLAQLPFQLTRNVLKNCGFFMTPTKAAKVGLGLDVAIAWGALNSADVTKQAGGRDKLEAVLRMKANSLAPDMVSLDPNMDPQ